ncbi:MAG: ATP-dependent DNA ligase [Candidatus Fermentithermobacillus carboniphilus]|uniref:DNA ligase (ATP) n=1 Tax=Candidatus Fermentithermobacillus carboniphilus TaxID=3085328 RepID=A0AAT9LCV2_9FIRM|nr:MAG: ATP-dependent DNA ligase [Candidatus Fermentithermobacillus carboniphilus]
MLHRLQSSESPPGEDPDKILGMPAIDPMLAQTATGPFDDENYLFEVKWDGYRCLAYLTPHRVYLRSRNGLALLPRFPVLVTLSSNLAGETTRALIDGEIVAFHDGKVDFSYLKTQPEGVTFVAFDILYVDERPLFAVPLCRRREILKTVVREGGRLIFSEAVPENGTAVFRWVKEQGLEGMMAKRKDSLYHPGERTRDWLKIKNTREGEFWVVGYLPSPGRRIGSLVLAQPEDGKFHILGRVSSGLDHGLEEVLLSILGQGLPGPDPRIQEKLKRSEAQKVRWVKPYFGVSVQYTEITSDGKLRHPVLRGLLGANASQARKEDQSEDRGQGDRGL